jgi:PAS domain S-box-containing protein
MEAEQFKQLVESAGDAVVIADREGVIRFWNAAAAALFGHAEPAAVGQSLDLIIPERNRARHWEGYHAAVAAGTSKYCRELLAVPGMRSDGSRAALEFTVTMLGDASGDVTHVAAVIRDVTERFQRERELRQRLQELEAKTGRGG